MKCPFCQHIETQVLETRVFEEGDAIRRRRRCEACDRRFTTYERAELAIPLIVKRNGSRESFDFEKLRASMSLALRKRPVSADVIELAMKDIQEQLCATGEKEVASMVLGEYVMMALKRLDKVAYIRFASVYKSFKDLDEFKLALNELDKSNG